MREWERGEFNNTFTSHHLTYTRCSPALLHSTLYKTQLAQLEKKKEKLREREREKAENVFCLFLWRMLRPYQLKHNYNRIYTRTHVICCESNAHIDSWKMEKLVENVFIHFPSLFYQWLSAAIAFIYIRCSCVSLCECAVRFFFVT
jgi:hypothetical protein